MKSNNNIGKPERASQNRVIQLFQDELGYTYLGDWEEEIRTQPIEEDLLFKYLTKDNKYSSGLAQKAVDAINAQRIAYNSGLTFKTQEEALKYIQSQKSSNAIKTDQGNYTIPGLSVEAQ